MIVKVLVENTSISEELTGEHGLSLYIERERDRILFDLGASSLFLENAKKMKVDIKSVDYLIISHGHYDHGGGIEYFIEENRKAKIYIHKKAFEGHYSLGGNERRYIGLDEKFKDNDRIIFTEDEYHIGEGLLLFTNFEKNDLEAISNRGLMKEVGSKMVEDDFAHEHNLIIEEGGKTVLITGCAHKGIINIIEQSKKIKGSWPDIVIGGFHLYNLTPRLDDRSKVEIDKISDYLKKTGSKYYTGHCTGMEPYTYLKSTMGDQIEYMSTGNSLKI